MSNIKILIVDDDPNICELLRLYCQNESWDTVIAHNGVEALELFQKENPDMVLLDIMMPELDGWQVCRNIRKTSDCPIIMVTAKGEVFDRILGLELGADDYIIKPPDKREMIARIKAVLRRSGGFTDKKKTIVQYDNLYINMSEHELVIGGKPVTAPPKELELLFFLANNPNRTFTRDDLLNEVWGYGYGGESRTVDVHIKRLREKIINVSAEWELRTVWGIGYKFETHDKRD